MNNMFSGKINYWDEEKCWAIWMYTGEKNANKEQ